MFVQLTEVFELSNRNIERPLWVNYNAIVSLSADGDDLTYVYYGDNDFQRVRETPEKIVQMITALTMPTSGGHRTYSVEL